MRTLSFRRGRVRGIRRRLRALAKWSEGFADWFPEWDPWERGFLNWKLPVEVRLVEGERARHGVQVECARLLLKGAYRLSLAKPEELGECRVVCSLSVPDFFGSEICIYFDEEYYRWQVSPREEEFETRKAITGKSLVKDWGLAMPPGFSELGVSVFQPDPEDGDYRSERWFLGETELESGS